VPPLFERKVLGTGRPTGADAHRGVSVVTDWSASRRWGKCVQRVNRYRAPVWNNSIRGRGHVVLNPSLTIGLVHGDRNSRRAYCSRFFRRHHSQIDETTNEDGVSNEQALANANDLTFDGRCVAR
jgi:hypothetical protein